MKSVLARPYPRFTPYASSIFYNAMHSSFLSREGWKFSMPQNRDNLLHGCEDPETLAFFEIAGRILPKTQSVQMSLEDDLLTCEPGKEHGLVTYGVSTRNESTADTDDRRNYQFPMIEIEGFNTYNEHQTVNERIYYKLVMQHTRFMTELQLLQPTQDIPLVDYETLCEIYGVETLEAEQEMRIYKDYGPVVGLINFPKRTNPFWNMLRFENSDQFAKLDLIVCGRESSGGAIREISVSKMNKNFYNVEGGKYAARLFENLGKENVERALGTYLENKFVPRFGAGYGLTRILQAMVDRKLVSLDDVVY